MVNTIDKFPFASDSNATDVADLVSALSTAAGHSSRTSGYVSGGNPIRDNIEKFSFSSDSNAVNVGILTVERRNVAGQQG